MTESNNTPGRNPSAEDAFWQWFLDHEEEIFCYEQDRERIFDVLHDELHKVDPHLAFEFGPPEPQRDFVLSAEGFRESFPAVIRLRDTAPMLPR